MTRLLAAEGMGTAMLLYVVVGSGIAAEGLGKDAGFQLLAHALVVGLGIMALIALFQTVSGSHFNPAVTMAFWRDGTLTGGTAAGYATSQMVGALAGVAAANVTFGYAAVETSTTVRAGAGLVLAEGISTLVLVLIILALVKTDRTPAIPMAVGAWVATVIFATSSTGFANPAVTVSRMLTSTYTGISPRSVPAFIAVQLLAGAVAASLAVFLFPISTRHQSLT
jgi:glycerol uptake facilitator-like aquaporin